MKDRIEELREHILVLLGIDFTDGFLIQIYDKFGEAIEKFKLGNPDLDDQIRDYICHYISGKKALVWGDEIDQHEFFMELKDQAYVKGILRSGKINPHMTTIIEVLDTPVKPEPPLLTDVNGVDISPMAFTTWNSSNPTIELKKEIERLTEQKDGAYAERNKLVAFISKIFHSILGRHEDSDTSWDNDWRNIVYVYVPILTPTGVVQSQVSWHIHDSELPLFDHLPKGKVVWDGHTVEEKYERLAKFSTSSVWYTPSSLSEGTLKAIEDCDKVLNED